MCESALERARYQSSGGVIWVGAGGLTELLLLRHGKAEVAHPHTADHERALTGRGLYDARRMGRFLLEHDLVPQLIVSSTAVRALQTAEVCGAASGYCERIEADDALYLAPPVEILAVVATVGGSAHRVLLVGHNPGLEDTVQVLSGEVRRMTTAGLVHLRVSVDSWTDLAIEGRATLAGAWTPKELD